MKTKLLIITSILLIATICSPTVFASYENHCWKCDTHISSNYCSRCPECGWYICVDCGACEPGCSLCFEHGSSQTYTPPAEPEPDYYDYVPAQEEYEYRPTDEEIEEYYRQQKEDAGVTTSSGSRDFSPILWVAFLFGPGILILATVLDFLSTMQKKKKK